MLPVVVFFYLCAEFFFVKAGGKKKCMREKERECVCDKEGKPTFGR